MTEKDMHSEIQDELRQIAPGLSEIQREDGFTTPHNYFKELPDRVMARIAGEKKQPALVRNWLQNLLKPRYAMALASILVLLIAGIWYSRMQSQRDPLASISKEEALEYVLNNLEDFSTEDLLTAGVMSGWDASEIAPVSDDELDQILEEVIEEGELIDDWMMN